MSKDKQITISDKVQNQIYTIRGLQVMVDFDLAELYQVAVKRLNEQVKRNKERFPKRFCFQLTNEEFENLKCQMGAPNLDPLRFQDATLNLKSQFATSRNNKKLVSQHGGRRKLPYVFTEQGISMLSAVLRSDVAIRVSIQIIDAFVQMRRFISQNAQIFDRIEKLETGQKTSTQKIDQILNALESKTIKPKQGIFYDGQIFDAYVFVSKIIKSANKSIVLIDNFVDESVLQLLTKRKKRVSVTIYTDKISKTFKQDLEKYNKQYPQKIEITIFQKAHDRFLIIDEKTVYHFGASLKDLGSKWFAFSKLKMDAGEIVNKLSN